MGNKFNRKWTTPKALNTTIEDKDIEFLDRCSTAIHQSRAVTLHRILDGLQKKDPGLLEELLGVKDVVW